MPSAFPTLDRPVDLVLHIGSGKTGTSSVQLMLEENRERLAGAGLLYPRSPGNRRHVRLGLAMRSAENLEGQVSWQRQGATSPARFRRRVLRRLAEEITESGTDRVLLSDESFYGLPPDALQRVRKLADGVARRTRVVVYLRRQDDHLCSRYQQVVKAGEVRRLIDRLEQMDMRGTYDYRARIQAWQDVVAPTEIVVRRFERAAFVDGSLYLDFLDAVGLPDGVDGLVEPARPTNESLDAESVEFLRILNLHRVEHEGATAGVIDNTELVARLAPGATGPTLTLPARALDELMASYAASNEAIARDFLGAPDGVLFRAPRKSDATTTEQRLDPARLDHFLEVVDLPESAHDGVRRIAEREAATWRPGWPPAEGGRGAG